jgi:hypothetical protein
VARSLKKLKPWQKWLIIGSVLIISASVLIIIKSKLDDKISTSSNIALESSGDKFVEKNGIKFRETNWKELVQLDYKSGEKTEVLKQVENQMVRIPGYIVPLADEVAILDEFLFVPNDQACIHVPPPPPNLIVKAKLKHKLPFEDVYNPAWLMGKLEIVPTTSQYGSAAYQIQNAEIDKYEESQP